LREREISELKVGKKLAKVSTFVITMLEWSPRCTRDSISLTGHQFLQWLYRLSPTAAMTADTTSKTSPDFVTVLSQAANAYRGHKSDRPSAELVVNALLEAEKAAKQQRVKYLFESIVGQWRLCFATGTKKVRQRGGIILGKGIYVPKFTPTYISFSASSQVSDETPSRGEIGNQIQLTPLSVKFVGPAQYLGKKNLLAFDFTQMQLSLFGYTIYNGNIRGGKTKAETFYNQSIAKQAFFAFFLVTEDFIAARGRGGGLALWIRES
jgi:hypothetical protein